MKQVDPRDRRLGAFLRARRERLDPINAGIAFGGRRRRTPGLRREEVAQLAGLSPTWYTLMEQGRDICVSAAALSNIAKALHLTLAERTYLFELAGKRDPDMPNGARSSASPPPVLARVINETLAPAYLLDRAWNACCWNDAARGLFKAWLGGEQRNLLRYVFLDPSARAFLHDWEHRAHRIIAEFRADTSRFDDDDTVLGIVEELRATNIEFATRWNDYRVLQREGGARRFHHPELGDVQYEQLTLRPTGAPDYKLVMLLPIAVT